MEGLPRGGGRGQRVDGDSFHVQRGLADLSRVFEPEIAQSLPVSCPAVVVAAEPLGPAACREQQ